MKPTAKPTSDESPVRQIAGFVAKFDPAMAKSITSARRALRKRLPTAVELVYDNYNFLVFGFGPSERASEAILSLAANAKGIGLCFLYGKGLPDPKKILQGSGNQTRFIRLESAKSLAQPEVEALIRAAIARARTPLPQSGRGYTVIRSVSVKQRPRKLPQK